MTGKTPSVPQINHVDKSPVGGSFTLERIVRVISAVDPALDPKVIVPEATLDALLDAYEQGQCWVGIEEEFGIEISTAEFEDTDTIGEFVLLVEAKGGG